MEYRRLVQNDPLRGFDFNRKSIWKSIGYCAQAIEGFSKVLLLDIGQDCFLCRVTKDHKILRIAICECLGLTSYQLLPNLTAALVLGQLSKYHWFSIFWKIIGPRFLISLFKTRNLLAELSGALFTNQDVFAVVFSGDGLRVFRR